MARYTLSAVPRHDMASAEHEGRVFYVGGFNTYEGTTIPIVEVYDFFFNRSNHLNVVKDGEGLQGDRPIVTTYYS